MSNYKITTYTEDNKTIINYSYLYGGMIKQIEIIGSLVTTTYFLEDKNSFGECIQVITDDAYYNARKVANSKEVVYISVGCKNSAECSMGTEDEIEELRKYIDMTIGKVRYEKI